MHILNIPQSYIKLFNNIMLSAQPPGPLNPADYIFTRGEGLTPTPPTCFTVQYTHTRYGAIYILLIYHPTSKCYTDAANVMPAHVTLIMKTKFPHV